MVGCYLEHMSKLHDKAYLPRFFYVSRRLCNHSTFVIFDQLLEQKENALDRRNLHRIFGTQTYNESLRDDYTNSLTFNLDGLSQEKVPHDDFRNFESTTLSRYDPICKPQGNATSTLWTFHLVASKKFHFIKG